MSNRELPPVALELIAAKKRIENVEDWCQGAFLNGKRMCAAGAIGMRRDNAGDLSVVPQALALFDAANELFGTSVATVNDSLGHAAVMQMYDHAIARAVKEGK